jgi:mono/diheme cytochrome c family protein
MTKHFLAPAVLAIIFTAITCKNEPPTIVDPPIDPGPPAGTSYLEPTVQRPGAPSAGYDYLVLGDYVSSGIPLTIFKQVFGGNSADDLGRTGVNDGIVYDYTAVTAANGAQVVAPNCLSCHAETLMGNLIIGLGNNTSDYTTNQGAAFANADLAVKLFYGQNSPEWQAYYPLSRASQAIGPYLLLAVRGVNPADKIFGTLSAFRHRDNLVWADQLLFDVPLEALPTDVPPWWNLAKKNALYYNGVGRGDFARLSAASGLLTMADSAEARRIDQHMPDLIAYLRTIEPPAYPFAVDAALAAEGRLLFEQHCTKCHGTYAPGAETYPNLLVDLPTVGTDPALSQVYALYPEYHNWYNTSWFAQQPGRGQLLPNSGYVAPPLDGIWATAPYLHNASVPTLDDLLKSSQRPAYWKRTFNNADYDAEKVGWHYTRETAKTGSDVYDTTLPGYRNTGHTFGDVLNDSQRRAVVEYLKTL